MEFTHLEKDDWARVWAKAILDTRPTEEGGKGDSSFKTKLETDPYLAARQFRNEFAGTTPFPDPEKLIGPMEEYEDDSGVRFSTMSVVDLNDVIKNGREIKYNELKKKKSP